MRHIGNNPVDNADLMRFDINSCSVERNKVIVSMLISQKVCSRGNECLIESACWSSVNGLRIRIN
jgi:hypothetical protein